MRISIGHRLFASVLLAILLVAAGAVFVLRHNVLASFGDYAVAIELDRLDELSANLLHRYRATQGWDFIPADARPAWIARELLRLQEARQQAAMRAATAEPLLRGAPQLSLPPLPPPPPPPPALPALSLPPPGAAPDALFAEHGLPLARRITLLDADGRYLAGYQPRRVASARRPLHVGGRTVGWLAVARSSGPSDAMAYAFLEQLHASLWLIVAGAVAFSALAAVLLARHFRAPILALEQGARQLSTGRFDVQLEIHRSDELGELGRHFNILAERLASFDAARRDWVANTSHELRTPLAVLRAQVEALQDGVRRATPDTIEAMLRQVLALNKLIDELYALARADIGALECRREALDLWRLASEACAAFEARALGAGVKLELGTAPPAARVLADPDRMRQVLDNLLENSLRYTTPGGQVRLQVCVQARQAILQLDDSAPGVPDEALARLGERFYRVDPSRSRVHGGAGLGLALCRQLLAAQGARLAFSHSPLGGLRVSIHVPLAPEQT